MGINRRTALNLRNPNPIDLLRPSLAPALRLGGDLAACAATIQRHLATWGSLRIIGHQAGAAAKLCAGS